MKSGLHLKDAQLFLDECRGRQEPVWVKACTKDGELVSYEGWLVISSWWKRGTHDLKNPVSGQIRKVRDILIMEVNGHPVYI